MPPKRRAEGSSNHGAADAAGVTPRDVSEHVHGENIPVTEDGQVAQDVDLPIEAVRKAGAVSEESARANRSRARFVHRKQNGDGTARFNSLEALEQFDAIRQAWGLANMLIKVTCTDPPEDYPIVMGAGMRHQGDLYEAVRKFHKNRPKTTYKVTFKEGPVERGSGLLHMPDCTQESPPEGQGMGHQPPHWNLPYPPPPGYYGGAPPPGYGPPGSGGLPPGYPPYSSPGYGYPGGPPPGYPPQGPGAYPLAPYGGHAAPAAAAGPSPAPSPAAAPTPTAAREEAASPQGYPHGYYPPIQPPPSDQSAAMTYAGYAQAREAAELRQHMQNVLMQNAQVLGELVAMRQAMVQQQQGLGAAPAAAAPLPSMPMQAPPGYPPMYGYPAPAPVPVPAPAPAAAPPAAAPPAPTPLETLQQAANQVSGVFETVEGVNRMIQRFTGRAAGAPQGGGGPGVLGSSPFFPPMGDPGGGGEEELPAGPPEPPSPNVTTMVGAGDKQFPLHQYRDTGRVNYGATGIGLIPVIGSIAQDILGKVAQMQDRQQAQLEAFAMRQHQARLEQTRIQQMNQQRTVEMPQQPYAPPGLYAQPAPGFPQQGVAHAPVPSSSVPMPHPFAPPQAPAPPVPAPAPATAWSVPWAPAAPAAPPPTPTQPTPSDGTAP